MRGKPCHAELLPHTRSSRITSCGVEEIQDEMPRHRGRHHHPNEAGPHCGRTHHGRSGRAILGVFKTLQQHGKNPNESHQNTARQSTTSKTTRAGQRTKDKEGTLPRPT